MRIRVNLIVLLLIISTSFSTKSFSQVKLSGKLSSENGPVVFASVIIRSQLDTTHIITQTISDLNGRYEINNVPLGRHNIVITASDVVPKDTALTVFFPSVGYELIKDYYLKSIPQNLEASVVVASRSRNEIDKRVLTITKDDIRLATSGIDLVSIIPQLSYSEKDRRIVALNGTSVKILVNGASSSEIDLIALNPGDIKSIEYYDMPPAKYFGYSKVINIITRRLDTGTSFGINAQSAVNARFVNNDVFVKTNWGNRQISISYMCNYRDYKQDEGFESFDYIKGGNNVVREDKTDGKFGYWDNKLNVSYRNSKPDDYLFQIIVAPNFLNYHSSYISNIAFTNNNDVTRDGTRNNSRKQFAPSVDLYYSKTLPKNQELAFNVVASLFSAHQDYKSVETVKNGDNIIFLDEMNQNNRKESIIGEMHYSKDFRNSELTVGFRGTYSSLSSRINNTFSNSEYSTRLSEDYIFAEYSMSHGAFSWRASLGGYYFWNNNHIDTHQSFAFRPTLLAMYKINENFILRGIYNRWTKSPSLSELSFNKVYINEDIVKEGNPSLVESTTDMIGVVSSYNKSPYVWLDLTAFYARESNPIRPYFINGGEYWIQRYENGLSEDLYALVASVRLVPLKKDLLEIKLNGQLYKSSIVGKSSSTFSYSGCSLDYSIGLNFNRIKIVYQGNIKSWDLEGIYMVADEPKSDLTITYKYKDFTFYAGAYWLLRDAKYESHTISTSPIQNYHTHTIRDNKNMFTLGVQYRFSHGKGYQMKQKSMSNTDSDAGLFNYN